MSYNTVLIDVNVETIRTLKELLVVHFPYINVIGTAQTFDNGVKLIEEERPQVIFLGTTLKKATGFDLLDITDICDVNVIFVADNEASAFKALKYQPIGYLIRPLTIGEMKMVMGNLVKKINMQKKQSEEFKIAYIRRIPILVGTTIKLINLEDILFCESCGNYSIFHFIGSNKIKAKNNIGFFETLLPKDTFFRIHKKYLVNLNHMKSLQIRNGLHCELPYNTFLAVSRRKKGKLLDRINYKVVPEKIQ